jgi:hypothetical protein
MRVIGGRHAAKHDADRGGRCILYMSCLRFNVSKRGFHPALGLHSVGPWDHICIDVGSLPLSSDVFCKILVAVDVATGFIVVRTCYAG